MVDENYRRRLKAQVMDAYGAVCACCGEDRMLLLTIDHVAGNGAAHRRSLDGRAKGSALYRKLRQDGYPVGYQVLCFNCNFAKGTREQCPCREITETVAEALFETTDGLVNMSEGARQLTDAQVVFIRTHHELPQRELADVLGVSDTTIYNARKHKTYKNVA